MALSYKKTRDQMESEGSVVGVLQLPKGVDLLKIEKACTIVMQILPYTIPDGAKHPYGEPGELQFFRPYSIYRNLGVTGKSVALNYRETFKPAERCAVTDFYDAHWTPPEDKPDAKKPRAQRKALVNVWLPEEEKHMVFDYSAANFIEKLFAAVDQKSAAVSPVNRKPKYPDLEYFADPDFGWVISVTFTEESFAGRKYFDATNFEFERGESIPQEIRNKAADLDTMLVRKSYAEVKALVSGEDYDEPAPTPPPAATVTKRPETPAAKKPETKVIVDPPPPEVVETVADAAPSEPVVEIAVGAIRHHPTYGQVEVVKLRDGKVTVSDKNEDFHTVPAESLTLFPADEAPAPVAEEPKAKAAKPKKTTTPAPSTAANADGEWPDWE